AGTADGQVILWDGETFKELRRVKMGGGEGSSTVRAVAFSPDGTTIAAGVELDEGKAADRVVLLDAATGERGHDLMPVGSEVRSLAFSPNGKLLLVACGIDRQRLKPVMTPDEKKAAGAVGVWEREPKP